MSKWSVPPLWMGGTCWIIGGGPSMPRQFDVPEQVIQDVMFRRRGADAYSPYLAPIHKEHVIGVNNAYLIGDWLDALFFGDCSWYAVHRTRLAKWPKLKVTCCNRFAGKREDQSEGIKYLVKDKTKQFGLSTNPDAISWNSNSGASAIGLAVHLGVKRIILLGFDMSLDPANVSHWHGSHHPTKGNPKIKSRVKAPPFVRHVRGFPMIAADAKERGIEIINASPTSIIKDFPKATVKELLNGSYLSTRNTV